MIVVYARSRWAERASWTWRTVWGSREDHRWSITARSRSPRRVNLAISRSSPQQRSTKGTTALLPCVVSKPLPPFHGLGAACSHRSTRLRQELVSRVTEPDAPDRHSYSKANLTY